MDIPVFSWHEAMSKDVEATKKFYGELLGWTTRAMDMGPMGTYHIWQHDGQDIGGLMGMDGPEMQGMPPHWMTYITVDDVDEKAVAVEKLGGVMRVPPTDIPDIGRFCVITDPGGAAISLIQYAERPAAAAGS